MNKTDVINILLVEDNPGDARLVTEVLKDVKLKFPNSLTPLLNSIDNLTERGLSIPFSSSNENKLHHLLQILYQS